MDVIVNLFWNTELRVYAKTIEGLVDSLYLQGSILYKPNFHP